MFSQILKDLITLHKLDSVGGAKSKDNSSSSTNKSSSTKHEATSSSKNSKSTNYSNDYGLRKSDAHPDLAKEFRTTFNKSNQSSNVKYNDGNKTSFGLKNSISSKMQSSQVKIENKRSTANSNSSSNQLNSHLDSKSSVNFYYNNNTDSLAHKLQNSKVSETSSSALKPQVLTNNKSSELKPRDPSIKNSLASVPPLNDLNELNEQAYLPNKNQNGSDASLRTRKQDALIDLAILLKKSQSKINLNGKLEDSQKLFEIQATLANEFKAAMLNRNNEEHQNQQQPQQHHQQQHQQQQQHHQQQHQQQQQQQHQQQHQQQQQQQHQQQQNQLHQYQQQQISSKAQKVLSSTTNTLTSDSFNPKYEALTKLTDEFRKNFTEIKKAYLNKDSQVVSNGSNPTSHLDSNTSNNNNLNQNHNNHHHHHHHNHHNSETKQASSKQATEQVAAATVATSSLSNDFKNSTAQINKSLKNLESKSSANLNSKILKADIQQNSNILNEFKLASSSRKNLASKSQANFYSKASSAGSTANIKIDSTHSAAGSTNDHHPSKSQVNFDNFDSVLSINQRKPNLASKSSANLYEPLCKTNLANEFKFSSGRKGLTSKSSANLYTMVDANTGSSNMYKSDTQPNLAREFKISFPQLSSRNLKDSGYTKSSTNLSLSGITNTNSSSSGNISSGYSPNLKNMYIQSHEYGDTYIVQRPENQTMTLTNEYKSNDSLRPISQENKLTYNFTKASNIDMPNPTQTREQLKNSVKNLNEVGLPKKKTNNSNDIFRKSTLFKDLKALETQTKIVNEFRQLSRKNVLESKSSSTFFPQQQQQLEPQPAASLPQPPPAVVISQMMPISNNFANNDLKSNKLETQTSVAREFKKSFTNLANLKSENTKSGVSSIFLSQPNSLQSDSPVNDSIDYEVNTVMMQKPPANTNEYKSQYIQPIQQQPIMVGNYNKAVAAEESQELLIELERTGISSSTPIEAINETHDSDLQNLNASELQKWIWTNEQEANNSLSPIPLNEYPINQDPNPIIIKKKPDQKVEMKKEFFVRYLQPPRPLTPGKLIIEQEPNVLPPEAPPIVIRQRPTRNRTPEPIIIREAPPTPPPVPPKQIITIPGKTIRQPREIIYEQSPKLKCEPQVVCHESCLPCNYCYQNQNMFQETWHPYNNGSNVSYQNQNVFHESWVPYKNQNGTTVFAQNAIPPPSWISYNSQPIFNQNHYGYSSIPYNPAPPSVYKYY